ncbi:capsular polysaccharide biosynthesis protein [Aeromonas veronii]|uniref:capsular polysaccharide biosynthesis protein n=1 Tax=Aeromonas veronii TaxID=654 RepID=UPI003982D6B5
MINRKFKKLIRSPRAFFVDAIHNMAGGINKIEFNDNRVVTYAFHVNDWKRPLFELWWPDRKFVYVPFSVTVEQLKKKWIPQIQSNAKNEIFAWGMNLPEIINKLPNKKLFVEDGFIRSVGLGATHTPPLSLNIDSQTAYFNAGEPSDLEDILMTYDFSSDHELLGRASTLMTKLVDAGISKYNHAEFVDIDSIYGKKTRKRVLVIGQVEGDASIKYGCVRKYTNNEAVMIAAIENPDAEIIYKPHPDVLNGHRKEVSNPDDVSHLCRIIKEDIPLSQSFETIDHVYTITSQAGFEALLRGIKVTTLGCPFYAGWGLTDDRQVNSRRTRVLSLVEVFAASYILYPKYFDPVYKCEITAEHALDSLVRRRCIALKTEKNISLKKESKVVTYAFHVNDWKRPLFELWWPDRKFVYVPFSVTVEQLKKKWIPQIQSNAKNEIFAWGMNLPEIINKLPNKKLFVEDGFIRSVGLGATHTPPLSLNIDSQTAYFNAGEPSDLEDILMTYDFSSDHELLGRASTLMTKLVDAGISKYNHAEFVDIDSIYGKKTRKRVLVIGQVEGDASIKYGCVRKYTNNEAVMIAAIENPDAEIIYKPHPDVLNGHRKEVSNPDDVSHLCRIIKEDIPLSQSFETIDHVYTITSQAGFEALLRGIKVTTLGCPFYAGWGLTDDRQVNSRRTRVLSLVEVFAASYILYPKYFDPLYKTVCDVETAFERLGVFRSWNNVKQSASTEDNVINFSGNGYSKSFKQRMTLSFNCGLKSVGVPLQNKYARYESSMTKTNSNHLKTNNWF